MPLGGGSNVLIADEGFPGLVVHVASRGVRRSDAADAVLLEVEAGEDWDPFVASCVAQGWAGVECLSGIPGRVGATPIQNVGAYGQEVKDVIRTVLALDTATDTLATFAVEACAFAYRDSRFKSEEPGRHVVLSVTYALRPGGEPTVRYGELSKAVGDAPSLPHVRETVLRIRSSKSMVLDADDPNSRSVGSFFTNPIVAADADLPEGAPRYPAGEGMIKLSAAWLIESAGFPRGYAMGPVGLSANHTLAIVNRGGATARDVVALKDRIQETVAARFGIRLVPEPVFVNLP